MKVLFDHQTFAHQEYGGISRYFYELAVRLHGQPNMEVDSSIAFSNNDYIRGSDILPSRQFFPKNTFKGKQRLMLFIDEQKSKRIYKNGDFDIFHPTYYDTYYVNYPKRKPVVVTCLDMIHEKFIKEDVRTAASKKTVLTKADHVVAISQSTKNDLMEYYKIPDAKISVTYLASSLKSSASATKPGEMFFLYVGKRTLYKNFIFFLKAIAPVLLRYPDLQVYCAGGGAFDKEELSVFKELKVENRLKLFSGSDESLQKLYSTALAFFYPSLYEGFGIPIVEAMSCGCPVAVSNTSSLPEVAGDAALYFDPNDAASIYAAAEALVSNPAVRSKLIEDGFRRAQLFSWEKTAEVTHAVYSQLI